MANCASTCANHISGSVGQKGGSLRAIEVIAVPSVLLIIRVTNVGSKTKTVINAQNTCTIDTKRKGLNNVQRSEFGRHITMLWTVAPSV